MFCLSLFKFYLSFNNAEKITNRGKFIHLFRVKSSKIFAIIKGGKSAAHPIYEIWLAVLNLAHLYYQIKERMNFVFLICIVMSIYQAIYAIRKLRTTWYYLMRRWYYHVILLKYKYRIYRIPPPQFFFSVKSLPHPIHVS